MHPSMHGEWPRTREPYQVRGTAKPGAHAAPLAGQAGTQHTAHHYTNTPSGSSPRNYSLYPLVASGDQLANLFTNIATPTPLVQSPQTQLPPGSLPGERVDLNPLNYLILNQRAIWLCKTGHGPAGWGSGWGGMRAQNLWSGPAFARYPLYSCQPQISTSWWTCCVKGSYNPGVFWTIKPTQ